MPTRFADAPSPLARRPVRDVEALRLIADLDGADAAIAARTARREVLNWARKRAGGLLPPGAVDGRDFELPVGGRNTVAVRVETAEVDLWALRAEDPDKTVPGRVSTTEIVIGGAIGERPRLSLRLIVSTAEPDFQFEPAVPGTVIQLIDAPGLLRGGERLDWRPISPATPADADDLCDFLEDPERRLPVFVATVPEFDAAAPLIDAAVLAKATAGLAHVVQVPAALTWVLTDRFGKLRSVFGGAVRAYMPGFSTADDPYRHRLFLAAALYDPARVQECGLWLRHLAAGHGIATTRLGRDIVDFASVRTRSRALRAESLAREHAPDADLLKTAEEMVDLLRQQLDAKNREIDDYLAEVEAAEERATAAEQENRALLAKIRQIQEPRAGAAGTPAPLPKTWAEFVDWLDATWPDRIVLTPAARRMVRSPAYPDVEQVARAVTWLATLHHDRRLHGGGSPRDEPIEPGVINAYCGGDSYKAWWQGRRCTVDQHVKGGGNTRDPKRCLRIYYFWEPDQQQTVIDHLPGHRTTGGS